MKNYTFVADFAVIIITAANEKHAEETLADYVKDPDTWGLSELD